MVAGAFPAAKLAYLAVKQISKPIANGIKTYAKRNSFFRRYVCLPPAQFYHWSETTFKMYLMGLGKPTKVAPLNEQMAVELGAELLGEFIVFCMAAVTIYYEYSRQSANAKAKEDFLAKRLESLEEKVGILINLCDQQDQRVREMNRHLQSSMYKSMKEKFQSKKLDEDMESEFKKLGKRLEADRQKLHDEEIEMEEQLKKKKKSKTAGDKGEQNDDDLNHMNKRDSHNHGTGTSNEKQEVMDSKTYVTRNEMLGVNKFQRLISEASNLILGSEPNNKSNNNNTNSASAPNSSNGYSAPIANNAAAAIVATSSAGPVDSQKR